MLAKIAYCTAIAFYQGRRSPFVPMIQNTILEGREKGLEAV